MASTGSTIRLDDQVAVVTGAGRGIGRSYALLLAERGATVYVNDIGVDDGIPRAQHVVDEIVAAGGRAHVSTHDNASEQAAGELIAEAIAEHGRLDILVHNAGLTIRTLAEQSLKHASGFSSADVAAVRRHIEVHVMGTYYIGLPAWAHMAERGYGRIVLTSSATVFGFPGDGGYAATKMAMLSLIRSMTLEAQQTGVDIKANAIAPTAATADSHGGKLSSFGGRLTPDNVAGAMLLMASQECPMSGECLRVGGSYVGRYLLGLTPGWVALHDDPITPEEVRDHFDEITAIDGFVLPNHADEVNAFMLERLKDARG